MTKALLCRLAVVNLSMCQLLLMTVPSFAQSVLVKGTVSTATKPVHNASVTFTETGNPGNSSSTLTDSIGQYRLDLTLTSVSPSTPLPAKFALGQNYPDPFSSSTTIPYTLRTEAAARITIYDILGRVVRETSAGAQSAGTYSMQWDGTNSRGHRVAPGVYFYRLQAAGESQAKKMIFGAGSGGVSPSQPPYFASTPNPGLGIPAPRHTTLGASFTINVQSTNSTTPPIVSKQLDNVVIQGDTTLNLLVDSVATPVSTVTLDSMQQVIRGYGAANILPWRPDMTTDEVQEAFGTGQGQLGFTILRIRIPYTDNPTDFSAQVPSAQLAHSLGAIVFATPWTPPPALKTSDSVVAGTLFDTSYATYAAHLKGFADYMAANGVPLYAVSIQNEPDAKVTYESCSWSATQFLKFVKNNAAAIGTRIMMPESQNFVHALSDSTLNDSAAAAQVAIIAGHIYGGGLGPYPLATAKGKDLWMTEHLVLDTSWTGVLGTGKEIHDCMTAGMNAYVWWYIVRYYGPISEDGTITRRGYVMSQFARFVRPGYHKILSTAVPQRNVWVSSYADPASAKVVIVALNMGTTPLQQAFLITHGAMTSFTPYTTSISKNCQQGTDLPVSGGRFTATLDASSITTFVSQ